MSPTHFVECHLIRTHTIVSCLLCASPLGCWLRRPLERSRQWIALCWLYANKTRTQNPNPGSASLVKGIPCAAPHPWGGMSIPAITTTHYDVGESMGGMRFLNGIFGRGMILYEWINVKDFLNISVWFAWACRSLLLKHLVFNVTPNVLSSREMYYQVTCPFFMLNT